MIRIKVETYAGYRAEETPRTITIGENRIDVERVLDRWLAPDHRYFKILAADGAEYIIRCDHESFQWELVYYEK